MAEKPTNDVRVRIAWLSGTAAFVILAICGVYLTDAIRTSDGERPPVSFVVAFSLLVSWLLKRYFTQAVRRKD